MRPAYGAGYGSTGTSTSACREPGNRRVLPAGRLFPERLEGLFDVPDLALGLLAMVPELLPELLPLSPLLQLLQHGQDLLLAREDGPELVREELARIVDQRHCDPFLSVGLRLPAGDRQVTPPRMNSRFERNFDLAAADCGSCAKSSSPMEPVGHGDSTLGLTKVMTRPYVSAMPLAHSRSKELFSDAYLRAVVAAARMHIEPRSVDVDGIDGYIHYTGTLNGVFAPLIAYQLKCTACASYVRDTHIAFPLPIKNYNELRPTNTTVPRILIVVLVPRGVGAWIRQDDASLLMRRCGYWVSLASAPASLNQVSQTVHVPLSQRLSVSAMRTMFTNVTLMGTP
jgi:hypothetical protein